MSLKFKPEDFDYKSRLSTEYKHDRNLLAKIANAKFQEWVESLDVVYASRLHPNYDPNGWSKYKTDKDTHQARIFDVREIDKECSHSRELIEDKGLYYYCTGCNNKVWPTGWDVIDE